MINGHLGIKARLKGLGLVRVKGYLQVAETSKEQGPHQDRNRFREGQEIPQVGGQLVNQAIRHGGLYDSLGLSLTVPG